MALRRISRCAWIPALILTTVYSTASAVNPDPTVARGAYLVLAGNCISCHTATGGKAFAGGRSFQTTNAFLGQLYSSNITPDRETGIGTWSEEDFVKAMRLGITPEGRHLLPAFPYTAFTKLTASDIHAIFAYLKTVPAVRQASHSNSAWFRLRPMMVIWNWLFLKPGELEPATSQSDEWKLGQYLIEALAHCGACHRPRNLEMAEISGSPLSGGVLTEEVDNGKFRRWAAPDLTPAKAGLATWSDDDLHKYLKSGHSRRAGVYGPMNEVFANSLRYLSESDISAMVTYLKDSSSATTVGATPILTPEERASGQALYDKHCEECHLSTGRGAPRKGPALAGNPVVQAHDAASLINVILHGADPSPGVTPAFDTYDAMPSFASKLTDREVATLATFLRAAWGNSAGSVSEAAVTAQH